MSFANFVRDRVPRYQPPVKPKTTKSFTGRYRFKLDSDSPLSSFILIFSKPSSDTHSYYQYETLWPNGEDYLVDHSQLVPV